MAHSYNNFLISQIEWLTSPANDVTQARNEVSAWPREANFNEPSSKELDTKMVPVLGILERVNFGVGSGIQPGMPMPKTLAELGYSVRLCLHQHRDARTNSGRAAQIRQRYFLQVIDWRAIAETDDRFLVVPNEYIGQWNGRRLRVKEPKFSGGAFARGSDAVAKMEREGKAVVYDHDFTSVIALPQGVRAKVIHHDVILDKAGQSHHADLPWSDFSHLQRVLFDKKSSGPDSVGKSTKIFDKAVADLPLKCNLSPGILLDELRSLVVGMSSDGSLDDAEPSGPILSVMGRTLLETCRDLTEAEPTFRDIASAFPKIVQGGTRKISIHLCATDIRRLGPDPTREITIWLTIVDLNLHNPVKVDSAGTLTARMPGDKRSQYVVMGEVVYMRNPEALAAAEQPQIAEIEE
jgi:hypothetical protein